MRSLLLLSTFLLLFVLACDFPVQPVGESPNPPESLDPQDIQVGEILFDWCRGWRSEEARASDEVLADIYFDPPGGKPTVEIENAVVERGGRVIHRFDLRVIRAEIPTSEIPKLSSVNHVREVPNPDRKDLQIMVMYHRPVEESDVERISELGGRVTRVFTVVDGLSAEMPDQSISALYAEDAVGHISYNAVACLGAGAP